MATSYPPNGAQRLPGHRQDRSETRDAKEMRVRLPRRDGRVSVSGAEASCSNHPPRVPLHEEVFVEASTSKFVRCQLIKGFISIRRTIRWKKPRRKQGGGRQSYWEEDRA